MNGTKKLEKFLAPSLYVQLGLALIALVILYVTRSHDDFSAFYAIYPMLAFAGLGAANLLSFGVYLVKAYQQKAHINRYIIILTVISVMIFLLFITGSLNSVLGY
ncbi:MAG TPA: hypothetical protein VNG90_04685, partial [Candidatus Acidoferrum sp.]|nr:hypothetical protein [Candidatus Acidoferrum sp.]